MAKKQRGGLLNRIFLGKEKSDEYARSTLPTNRWELFWDIFKGRFGKLVILNLLMLIFFIPLILLIIYRQGLISSYGSVYPFAQSFGVGYSAPLSLVGYSENIVFSVNAITYLFLPVAVAFAAVGLSGGAYVMRNIVWTEGVFIANDFWKGIKLNFKQIMLTGVLYSVVFYVFILSISFADQMITTGTYKVAFIIVKIVAIILLSYFSLVALHMITLSVTYEYKFRHLIRNGMVLSLGFLVQNVFFVLLAAIPFFLMMLQGFFLLIGICVLLFFGLSYVLLIWTDYCQWIYDGYINGKIQGAKKNRGIYEKVKADNSTYEKYKEQQKIMPNLSKYASRPVKPITDDELTIEDLPQSFSRKDIERLNESKKALYEDNERYIKEHENDERYKQVEEDKKEPSEMEKRIAAAKRELEKREREKNRKNKK